MKVTNFMRQADTRTPVERELDDLYQALDGCHSAYQNYYAAAARGDTSGWMTPDEIAEDEEAHKMRIALIEGGEAM